MVIILGILMAIGGVVTVFLLLCLIRAAWRQRQDLWDEIKELWNG